VSALLERIAAGVATDADYSTLRQLLLAAPQRLTQLGKYNIQIGEGHDIQIGDRTYGDINDDALQAIVEAIQQAVKAAAPQVQQTVSGNQNQVIAEMRGGTAINTVQGEVHIHQPAPPTAPALTTFFGVSYPRNPYFTGREETLNQLQQQLNQNRTVAINQIQAISGLGGLAKPRLPWSMPIAAMTAPPSLRLGVVGQSRYGSEPDQRLCRSGHPVAVTGCPLETGGANPSGTAVAGHPRSLATDF
jgi:hypothetical protein